MEQEPKLDPSAITDVETAKLALRWAVEKIHGQQEELGRLRDDNRNKTGINRSLTEQVEQKTEILKKWQGTIKTWEENWKTQTAMEADLKSKLREQILNEVWGYEEFPTTRTIDNFVAKLRQKIEHSAHAPEHILTIHGSGYKFVG